jgi:hypothetical protein
MDGKMSRPMTPDEREVFERLLKWQARVEAIMEMYDKDRTYIPALHIEQARVCYKGLKEDLRAEHKRLSNSQIPNTEAEERWYGWVIHEALGVLRAATNSRPEQWHSCLYNAGGDFSSAVDGMRGHFDLPDPGTTNAKKEPDR